LGDFSGFAEGLRFIAGELSLSGVSAYLARHGRELNKTTIQNYVRQGALPPPDGRRYGKRHVLALFLIEELKETFSLSETGAVLRKFPGCDELLIFAGEYFKLRAEAEKTAADGGPAAAAAMAVAGRGFFRKFNA
jgi:DNA-binding transcriptional MerR regulator